MCCLYKLKPLMVSRMRWVGLTEVWCLCVHGLRVITAYKHDGCTIPGKTWLQWHHNMDTQAADYPVPHRCCQQNGTLNIKSGANVRTYSRFLWSILCIWIRTGWISLRPHLPPCPQLLPYLPPLPCVRPSRCSRAASTSFKRRAPGESQPPLVDR